MVKVLLHILILYGFYLVGTFIQEYFGWLIPGSIIGMLLLFTVLMTKIFSPKWIEGGARWLLAFMPLFFLPVTVGVVEYLDFFLGEGFALVLVTFLSTVIVMATAGFVVQWTMTKKKEEREV